MRRLFVRFATGVQGAVMGLGLFAFITLHPATTDYLAQKALKDNGVAYSRIEGTLFTGFDLYDVRWQKAFYARRIALHYSVFRLLSPRPTVGEALVEQADLYPLRIALPQNDANATASPPLHLPPILVRRIVAKSFRIHVPDTITADLRAERLLFADGAVTVPSLDVKADSPWARAAVRGRYEKEVLEARGEAMVSTRYRRLALRYVKNLPESLPVTLRIDPERLDAATEVPDPVELKEGNLSVAGAKGRFTYRFGPNYMEADADYELSAPFAKSRIAQHLILTPSLAYATTVEGKVVDSLWAPPAKRFTLGIAGGPDAITADAKFGPLTLSLYSADYERYALTARAEAHPIDYIHHLPKIFSSQTVSMEGNATLALAPEPGLRGVVALDGNFSSSKSYVEWHPDNLLIKATVEPKNVAGGIWEVVPPMFKTDIHTYLYYSRDDKLLNVSTRQAYLTLFERERLIKGWANIGSLTLDVKGDIEPDDAVVLDFHTRVASLYALTEELGLHSEVTVDAEVESRFRVVLSDRLSVRYDTKIPWYLVQPDSQTVYYGLDSELTGGIRGEEISVESYDIGFLQRRFKQSRPSYFHFDEDFNFYIDRLTVLDTGTVTGVYRTNEGMGDLHLRARSMHYEGPEGRLALDAAIDANLSAEALNVEGEVKLLGGEITYMPQKSYTVTDDDIVIIQDIKEPGRTRKSLNVHIYADKPIRYKVPMAQIAFRPDVTVWKEPFKPTVLLGIVRIDEGAIDVEDKHFVVEPSEIYFAGAYPPNPYLDLHILYELDFYRFNIYVSHTLSDPVFLFSSEPPMSQNDIMSYILFGTPANESFQGGREPTNSVAAMLLGLGIKNAIGAATGLKFDTFNILNTDDGGFGIEIGKRLGKRFRIIYRNDTLSSFILQYTLSRSVRVDVDVRETGQGVNVLYVKDFRGPKALDRRIEIIEPK